MSVYRVRIEADKAAFPALLSNGNLAGDRRAGRRAPLGAVGGPLPQALLSVRAGGRRLSPASPDTFATRSGRTVQLRIYSEHANIDQCHHAMASLKKSMKWDEERYGLEYDLDLFQIVAVNDFNFGAMENKGLNIFNTSATLARADTATDADFVQRRAHHCPRIFPQLDRRPGDLPRLVPADAKEGLTVFRDQQFSADMHSAAVKRIGDVAFMRDAPVRGGCGAAGASDPPRPLHRDQQFLHRHGLPEGRRGHPHAPHPDRRGGLPGRRSGLYFERHDGQAVTCEDFVRGDGRRLGPRSRPVHALVRARPARPSSRSARSYDPARQALHAGDQPEHARDARPAGEAAVPHPDPHGPRSAPDGARAAAAARGRERTQGHRPRARAHRGDPALHLPRPRRRSRCPRCCAASRPR